MLQISHQRRHLKYTVKCFSGPISLRHEGVVSGSIKDALDLKYCEDKRGEFNHYFSNNERLN